MPPPTQPRPWASQANAAQESTLSYDSADFQDVNMNTIGRDTMVSAAFVEAVAQSMGFSSLDQDYRNSLHSIPKVRCTRS